jgi:hypothetical protein
MRRWGAAIVGVLLLSFLAAGNSGAGAVGPGAAVSEVAAHPAEDPAGPLPFNDPAWAPGFYWKYDVRYKLTNGGQFIDLDGSVNTTAAALSNVTIGNQTHQTLKITNSGGGNAAGNISVGNFTFPFRGPWTLTGTTHAMRGTTDEVQIEQKIVLVDTATTTRVTVFSLLNYTPALTNLEFPMDDTTKWTYSGQESQYNWTYIETVQGNQYIAAPSTTITNQSLPFKTLGPFYRTVPAGTFYCLQVTNGTREARGVAQPLPGAAEQFYSDGAGNSVQIEFQDQAGVPIGYFNLSETNYKPPAGKYGSQGGHVRDKVGNPLKNAKVTATPASGPGATAYTDASGAYVFTNLAPGTYTVKGNLSGYVDAQKSATVAVGSNPDVDLVLLRPTGTMTITTQDETSAPLGEVTVRILGGGVDLQSKTDSTGMLTIEVGIGTYNVTGSKPGYKQTTMPGVLVELQKDTPVTIKLEKVRGSVAGKVTDSKTGFGIAGAKIAVSKSGTVVTEVTTDSNGTYRVDKLDPGTYMLTASAAGYKSHSKNVSVVGGQEKPENFPLQKESPPVDQNQSSNSLALFGAIGGVLAAIVIVALILMMRAKKKKQAEDAARRARQQQGPQEPQW